MKVAVSIPDTLYEAAEEEAGRLAVSRSELYAKALQAYLLSRPKSVITRQLNEVYDHIDSKADPVMQEMSRRTLGHEEW